MNIRRFFGRKRPTTLEIWKARIEAFFVGAAIILFWRGIWNLADIFLFPMRPIHSALAGLIIGLLILLLSGNFVSQFIDDAVDDAEE